MSGADYAFAVGSAGMEFQVACAKNPSGCEIYMAGPNTELGRALMRAYNVNHGPVQELNGTNWVAVGNLNVDVLVAGGAMADENGRPIEVAWTFNVGVQGGYTLFGVSGIAFGGVVVDGLGNWSVYVGAGSGLGFGGSLSGGVDIGFSTGNSVNDFGGVFQNTSISAGAGAAGTVDLFRSPDGQTVGGGFSVGPGLGGSAFTGPTNTWLPYTSVPRMPARAP